MKLSTFLCNPVLLSPNSEESTKLSIHSVVAKIEEQIKSLTDCYLDWIDENGNIVVNLQEISSTVHQEFEITARRKKLRRLEQIAAFNVATQLSCQSDTNELPLPKQMKKLVNMYIDTFSVDL